MRKRKRILSVFAVIGVIFLVLTFSSGIGSSKFFSKNKEKSILDKKLKCLEEDLKKHVYKLSHEIGDRGISRYTDRDHGLGNCNSIRLDDKDPSCYGKYEDPVSGEWIPVSMCVDPNYRVHCHCYCNYDADYDIRYKNLKKAEEYITDHLKSYGYDVKFQEYKFVKSVTNYQEPQKEFNYGDYFKVTDDEFVPDMTVKNIIVTKIGKTDPDRIIVVGAHYDTFYNPGADDNASGVAGLLELAQTLASIETEKTIELVFFVNEELPFFHRDAMGSLVYAREARAKGKNIEGAIIFEMIGSYSDEAQSQRYPEGVGGWFMEQYYGDVGNFIMMLANYYSSSFATELIWKFERRVKRNNLHFPVMSTCFLNTCYAFEDTDESDHWSFWQEGYPAIMISDGGYYRNKDYHRVTDTYEKLDYKRMAEFLYVFKSALISLANDEEDVVYDEL